MLLAWTRRNSSLAQFKIVIVDDAHEHTAATDLVLGLPKTIAKTQG